MVVRNHDENAQANDVLGDEYGGNVDQPEMDIDEQGRLAPPVDAADFLAGPNPFADDVAQAALNKPTGKPKDEGSKEPAKEPAKRKPAAKGKRETGIALDESPGAEAGTPGGDAARTRR